MITADTRVLVVDQERFASLIVKMLAPKCKAEAAFDGTEAVRKLREATPDVIIVEQNVGGGGIRLAELVGMNPKYAALPVILTSTRPSPETIMQARNAGVSSYLAKPFRPSELLKRIESALSSPPPGTANDQGAGSNASSESEATDEAGSEISSRVAQIDGLPPFPATHAEILKLTKSDQASSEDLAEKIQMDPSFLATVLKLANSSYYGLSKKTTSLKMAVTRLGMEELSNLVMAAQVFKNLGGYENGGGLDVESFWKHSESPRVIRRPF
jgi:DNA-binding response OmpR family regulator